MKLLPPPNQQSPKRSSSFIRSLFLSALLATFSQITPEAQAENEPTDSPIFKVGVMLCLTGACAEPGTNALHGIELAAEELNSKGGILGRKIVLVAQDTREVDAAANSVTAYQTLALDKDIHFIIGPTWTAGALPLVPIVSKRTDLVMTSPSVGVELFNESADHLFNTWPHDRYSTEALAQYAIDQGWKRGAVLSNQGPWESVQAKVFAEAFKKLGGTVVTYEEPLVESRDLKSEALKIKGQNPDFVFMSNYTQMDIAAKELERLRYRGKKMAILMDETRIRNADGALEETIFARYPDPSSDFGKRYDERFKQGAGIASDTAYDTLGIYAKAIESAKSFDPAVVKKEILAIRYRGASGEIVFDGKGGVVKRPQFWVVKDGKQQVLMNGPSAGSSSSVTHPKS